MQEGLVRKDAAGRRGAGWYPARRLATGAGQPLAKLGRRVANLPADFYTASAQPGWAQSQEISTSSPPASSQRWLQYFFSSGTMHRHAGCAHLFCSIVAIFICPFLSIAKENYF